MSSIDCVGKDVVAGLTRDIKREAVKRPFDSAAEIVEEVRITNNIYVAIHLSILRSCVIFRSALLSTVNSYQPNTCLKYGIPYFISLPLT